MQVHLKNYVKYMKTKSYNIFNIIVIILISLIVIFSVLLLLKNNKITEYKIILNGDKNITINQGEKYIEPGFIAYENDSIVTDKVVVKNEVLENIAGIYRITYELGNCVEYRYVEVKELIDYTIDINLEVNNTNLTNQDINVNVKVIGDTFKSLTLPDGSIIEANEYNYVIKENGLYKFTALNSINESVTKEISINNIDKEAPIGTCSATLFNKNTSIDVKANESNITYHYYDNNSLLISNEKNNLVTNKKTSEIIKVIMEDEVGNKNEIKCSITDNRYHEPVIPSSSDKVVYHGDSDTLKTYIVNKGSYYLTYIWVKDAYTQLNKSVSPEYGKKLYYPKELLNRAVTNNNLTSKIMVGFNASGFYLRDKYDAISVSVYSAYDRTSVGTIVINNGNLVRNAYNYFVKTWYIVGVNKDNKLLVFEDAITNSVSEKQAWAQTVISSGIRNTFTFAAPIIENGQRTNITTSMPGGLNDKKGLQLICQINENNFLLFTARDETRNKAITEFMNLGCQTAMNLDGGGSIALFYKDKNSNEIVNVIGGSRELPEVGYFNG